MRVKVYHSGDEVFMASDLGSSLTLRVPQPLGGKVGLHAVLSIVTEWSGNDLSVKITEDAEYETLP